MDSRDTRANPHMVKAPPWSINGPYKALKLDLLILLLFVGLVYIMTFYIYLALFTIGNMF